MVVRCSDPLGRQTSPKAELPPTSATAKSKEQPRNRLE
jgi:hypothetical protein